MDFIQKDIFLMDDLKIYDKMIMADVVEHIEQEVLERIFEKLAHSLSKTGILVIHTAPNRDHYEYDYPVRRENAARVGCFLPKEPRSYYEQLMHINEQTPQGLQSALERYFPFVHVWTGSAFEFGTRKTPEESRKDIEIFACAANDRDTLDRTIADLPQKPSFDACHVHIAASGMTIRCGQTKTVEVTVDNVGSEIITSRRRYPIFLSYHILDMEGQVRVYDGLRSMLPLYIRPGGRQTVAVSVKADEALPEGEYILRLTGVSESLFWLDDRGENYTDVTMTIEAAQ